MMARSRFWGLYAMLGVAGLGLLVATPDVTIRLRPQVVMVGGTVQLTCIVAPDARNRRLDAGLKGYQTSSRDLAGEDGPRTTQFPFFTHIPCGVDTAFCRVLRNDGTQAEAHATLIVSNCN